MQTCARCHSELGDSTATVYGTEGYPSSVLKKGDPLCADCAHNRSEAGITPPVALPPESMTLGEFRKRTEALPDDAIIRVEACHFEWTASGNVFVECTEILRQEVADDD